MSVVQRSSAGNQGDVVKHTALLACVAKLHSGTTRFIYAESHAGTPFTRLKQGASWEQGIGVLRARRGYGDFTRYRESCEKFKAPHLDRYAACARLHVPELPQIEYPGSTALVRAHLYDTDALRMHLFDTDRSVCDMLRAEGPAHIECADGYTGIARLCDSGMPLDFALIDPFKLEEWDKHALTYATDSLTAREVPYLVWLPGGATLPAIKGAKARRVTWALSGCHLVFSNALSGTIDAVLDEIASVLAWYNCEIEVPK